MCPPGYHNNGLMASRALWTHDDIYISIIININLITICVKKLMIDLKVEFVSENVINLSGRDLSKAEISLLSKSLKFVPTPTNVNKAILKEEVEKFGRRLRLKWHFRDEDNIHIINPFKKKSKFIPKWKDAAIEYYLSRLEKDILAIDTKLNYANLTREEREALKTLRYDISIIIKEADKGSAVVVWDREDYLKEANRQL